MAKNEIENFHLGQLSTFGIVVNPQWTIASLQPEDLYLISVECCTKIFKGESSSSGSSNESTSKKHNLAAVTSWIQDNLQQDNAATVYKQSQSDLSALPKKLPGGAKERFDSCSTLAQILKSIVGLPDHVDYSAIMYPNEKNSRDLISSLLERLSDHQDRLRSEIASSKNQQQASSGSGSSSRNIDNITAAFTTGLQRSNRKPFQKPVPRRFIRMSNKKHGSNLTSVKKSDQVVSTALFLNSIRRLEQQIHKNKLFSTTSSGKSGKEEKDDPEWILERLKALGLFSSSKKNNKKNNNEGGGDDDDDLLFGSVADVAPLQAAAAEKEAAEVQARLKKAEANVEAMKHSVEDAQRARELEDEDLSTKLKDLKSGIKLFKNKVKSAKSEMESLEEQFLALENSETEAQEQYEKEMALITARREIIDGVASGGEEFVSSLEEKLESVRTEHSDLLREIETKLGKSRKKQQHLRDKIAAMGPTKKERLAVLHATCKDLARECRQKLEEHDLLEAELEKSRAKSKIKLDRGVLSRMIYEVTVRRHAKQQEQIEQIVNEIGIQERRINELSSAIATRYAQIENDMYAAAKTDTAIRDLFTPLVGLRGEYVALVKRIGEIGKSRKEIHDVDSRLNKLMRFSDSSMLSSAERDLQLVKESISSVQGEIDKFTSGATAAANEKASTEEEIHQDDEEDL